MTSASWLWNLSGSGAKFVPVTVRPFIFDYRKAIQIRKEFQVGIALQQYECTLSAKVPHKQPKLKTTLSRAAADTESRLVTLSSGLKTNRNACAKCRVDEPLDQHFSR